MRLYAATSNPGKLAEFSLSASTHNIDVLPLPNIQQIPEPVEDALTFQGNADLKAIAYSLTFPNALVFADDSGLEVPALHNAPGVRSARFAEDQAFDPGNGSKDDRNNRCLLHLLSHEPDRTARFVCTLALARDGQILLRAQGAVEGQLLTTPRGDGGFGYDPLFLLPPLNRTLAEIPRSQKWELSHRGNAFRELLIQIDRYTL